MERPQPHEEGDMPQEDLFGTVETSTEELDRIAAASAASGQARYERDKARGVTEPLQSAAREEETGKLHDPATDRDMGIIQDRARQGVVPEADWRTTQSEAARAESERTVAGDAVRDSALDDLRSNHPSAGQAEISRAMQVGETKRRRGDNQVDSVEAARKRIAELHGDKPPA